MSATRSRPPMLFCLLWLWALPPSVGSQGFDPQVFDVWVDARAGGGDPVYWYSTGTVREFPSGKLLFLMEGYDTARAHRPDPEQPVVHQYNRKIYLFRDPDSGEVVTSWNGQPVEPIAYPYQFITYELAGERLNTRVEQGAGAQVRSIEGDSISHRRVGDTHVFTAPVFLDFPVAGAEQRYQAWENYDFFINPAAAQPHQLSWARVGPMPPWAGGVPSVMHLLTWRIDDFADLPESLKTYIKTEAPLWQQPPADLDEIRRLQQPTDARP